MDLSEIKQRIIELAAVCSCAAFLSCAAAGNIKTETKQDTAVKPGSCDPLINILKEINSNAPSTISASFTADGINNGQKFKIEGTVQFDRAGFYSISVVDYVFRSKVLDAYRDADRLYFSYPAEKTLLTDDVNKIDISRYTGFKAEYMFMYTLLTGGIPVIKEGKPVNCVPGDSADSFNLVFESGDYMENIFIRAGVPEKIMVIHKTTKDRMEIYLKSPVIKDKSIFFKSIRIVAPERKVSVNIKFSGTKLNEPVKVDRFNPDKVKKGTEIIRVN